MIPRYLLPNRVSITQGGGYDQFGPLPGEEITVRALVEEENRIVRNSDGEEKVSGTRVYLDPLEIAEGTPVTVWPDDEGSRKILEVVAVSQFRAPGKSHTVLDLI